MALTELVLLSAGLTFVQLGFIGIGVDGSYIAYAIALLVVVMLGSLLLGRTWGTLVGAVSGTILYLHAAFMPLDIYEMYFVTALNSIALLAFMGLFSSVAFSIALRNNPSGVRRVVYIGIVCLVSSLVTTELFVGNIVLTTVFRYMGSTEGNAVRENLNSSRETMQAILEMGRLDVQVLLDFLLAFFASCAVDAAVRAYERVRGNVSVRTTFNGQLLAVCASVFLIIASGSFVAITRSAEDAANDAMTSKIKYLCTQLSIRDEQFNTIVERPELEDLSEKTISAIIDPVALDKLIDGYSMKDDGTIVVFTDYAAEESEGTETTVILSDNKAYPVNSSVEDLFGDDGAQLIKDLAESGQVHQYLYDAYKYSADEDGPNDQLTTQIGYLRVGKINDYYVMIAMPSSRVFEDRSITMTWLSIAAFVLLVTMYLLVRHLLRIVVTDPIDQANDSLSRITSGDLDERVNLRRNREFSSLSDGINQTVDALRALIAEAETRNERDLTTAKAIQESALPNTFPAFPELDAFDIYASMNAAKEVGGDFYDFFLIDDHTLGFLIADVSGKGIPASLFMMAAKSELQNFMSTGMELSQAVASANVHLCEGNDAGMFVTVWAATLDWETGRLTYVNAGHNFPLLRHNGTWEWITKRCGLFLGTFETAKYRQQKIMLTPGDQLILYTDGVNEAFNANEEEYGNNRLEEFLRTHAKANPRELVMELRNDIAVWAEGAEQSDDITMLCLEYGDAPTITGTATYPATLDYVEEATNLIDEELDKQMCPPAIRNRIDVAFEELFVNVCSYAYADLDEPGEVTVSYAYSNSPTSITIELRDQGMPFNPLLREDPTRPKKGEETRLGGLGIMMVKRFADSFTYKRDGNSNVVAFTKRW